MKTKIITGLITAVVLITAFFQGGNAPDLSDIAPTAEEVNITEAVPEETEKNVQVTETVSPEKEEQQPKPVSQEPPVSVEPQETEVSPKELSCTLSVRCDTVLSNIEKLEKEKVELVPADGVIFAEKNVMFYEGESVFNILMREMKRNKIHMEFVDTPAFNSVYIEGIANLYEFDCGELSGWMYKVNGQFPNYGCSRYLLKDGDIIEWVYTCDLGRDVGGEYSARNGM